MSAVVVLRSAISTYSCLPAAFILWTVPTVLNSTTQQYGTDSWHVAYTVPQVSVQMRKVRTFAAIKLLPLKLMVHTLMAPSLARLYAPPANWYWLDLPPRKNKPKAHITCMRIHGKHKPLRTLDIDREQCVFSFCTIAPAHALFRSLILPAVTGLCCSCVMVNCILGDAEKPVDKFTECWTCSDHSTTVQMPPVPGKYGYTPKCGGKSLYVDLSLVCPSADAGQPLPFWACSYTSIVDTLATASSFDHACVW